MFSNLRRQNCGFIKEQQGPSVYEIWRKRESRYSPKTVFSIVFTRGPYSNIPKINKRTEDSIFKLLVT